MKPQVFSLRKSLLFYLLVTSLMSMFCLSASQDKGLLCNMNTCQDLDNCQSLGDALSKGLIQYKTSQDISALQLSEGVLNSFDLYNMTARYLNVFNGLSRSLDAYMTSGAYITESRNPVVKRFTMQFRFNLTLLIDYTNYAVEEMSWTLYNREHDASSIASLKLPATKDVSHGHSYLVSDMFKTMLNSWRSSCGECRNHLLRKKREICSRGKTGVNVMGYLAKKEQKKKELLKNKITKAKKQKRVRNY